MSGTYLLASLAPHERAIRAVLADRLERGATEL